MNIIFTIYPYLDRECLSFDDNDRGLVREPFVLGADLIIRAAAEEAGHDPLNGFPLHFSASHIPGALEATKLDKEAAEGAWYSVNGLEGWLCPATLKYFTDGYPSKIFFTVPKKG